MKTWISLFLLVFTSAAQAHNYKYSDLVIKDYDEMNAQVQSRIKKARNGTKSADDATNERVAIEELRDALKLIMSRPNSDNMVAKLTPEVRRELSNLSAFEDTVSSLAAEALGSLKDKNATVALRSTNLFVLENILSEIRPEIGRNEDLRRVTQRVADAKIEIDKDVSKDRQLRSMFKTVNPSEMARDMLKAIPKEEKKSEEKKAKEEKKKP